VVLTASLSQHSKFGKDISDAEEMILILDTNHFSLVLGPNERCLVYEHLIFDFQDA
jgi:hypothetical protein